MEKVFESTSSRSLPLLALEEALTATDEHGVDEQLELVEQILPGQAPISKNASYATFFADP